MYEFSPDAEFTLEQVKLRRVSYRLCWLAGRPPLPGMEANWEIPPFLKISRKFVESISSRTDNLDFGEYSMEYLVDIVLFLGLEEETCLMQHVGDRRGMAKALSSFLRGRAQLLEGTRTSTPALSGSGITTAGAGRSRIKKGRSRSGKISRSRNSSKLGSSVGAGSSGSSGSSDKRRRANPAGKGAVHGAQTRAPLLSCEAGGEQLQLRVSRKRKTEADASSFPEETIEGFHVSGGGGDTMVRSLAATSASRAGHGGRESIAQGCTSEATSLGYPATKVRRPRTQAKDPSAPAYADMISKAFSELGKTYATHSELCGVIQERYTGLLLDDRDPYEKCPRWRTCIRKVLQGNDRFGVEGSQGVKRFYSLLGR